MTEQWQNLSSRERLLVSLMGVTCLFGLLYFFALKPLFAARNQLRKNYENNTATLEHLTNAVPQILQWQRIAGNPKPVSQADLLEQLQTSLESAAFSSAEKTIQQTDSKHVMIQWNEVPFDQLIDWLDQQWRESEISVSQMDVTTTTTAGVVKARVVLTSK